jgi:hypothetical protein
MRPEIQIGDKLVCLETHKPFTAASDGFTFNYARGQNGEIFSDEGVDIREKRELLDRSKPFYGYVSSDGKHITGWKGNVLGTIVRSTPCRLTRVSYTHGKSYLSIRVRDIHGAFWHGRGSPGICITLRACRS